MPVHDWTRVVAGNFHDFHQKWIAAISNLLNEKLLPKTYYSMVEQHSLGVEPDVVTLERVEDEGAGGTTTLIAGSVQTKFKVQEVEPQTHYKDEVSESWYAARGSRVTVYHANGDRVVAYIEIVSFGNKDRAWAVQAFNDKLDDGLHHGCHLLVIDLHPPTSAARQGMHAAFWARYGESSHGVTPDEPLGIAAYRAERINGTIVPTAYFERLAVGQNLPVMPLFLTSDEYINLPLQETYDEAWRGVPARWKTVLETPDTP
jgi:hypothetical protein